MNDMLNPILAYFNVLGNADGSRVQAQGSRMELEWRALQTLFRHDQ
jgi:hypothetical protein